METISNENRDTILKNLSLFFSVVALILSLIAVVGLNKLQNKILSSDMVAKITSEKSEDFKIETTNDVEVLHSDGSTEKVKAKNSEDKISMVIEEKIEQPKNKAKKEKIKKNVANKTQKFNVVERQNQKIEIQNTKQQNIPNNTNRNVVKVKNEFYIQLGVFGSEISAQKNCDKIKKSLVGKLCSVKKDKKNRFASVIQDFATKEMAMKFAQQLATKENISFLIKKTL